MGTRKNRPTINVLSKNKRIVKKSTENCLFYSREKSQYMYIARACDVMHVRYLDSTCITLIVRLSLLRKTILIPGYMYKVFMCVCVFVDGCISQF